MTSVLNNMTSVTNNVNRYFFFDLETTGLPSRVRNTRTGYHPPEEIDKYDSSRIVSVAWMVFNEDGILLTQNHKIVYPDNFVSSPIALNVHGISKEYAEQVGMSINEIFPMIEEALSICTHMIGYNVKFDYNILLSECYRYHYKPIINLMHNMIIRCAQREVVKSGKNVNARRKFYPRLEESYRGLFNDYSFNTSHDALDDTLRCAQVYFKLNNIDITTDTSSDED